MKTREEQYPLLLFFVGGGGDDHQHENRRFFRGRFAGITTGASSVINQWPSYMSSCWVTTIVCGVCLLMATLLLMALVGGPNHVPLRLPRCASKSPTDNQTIHLIQDSPKWKSQQLQLLDEIAEAYPEFKIRVIGVHPPHKKDFVDFFAPRQIFGNNVNDKNNQSMESIIFKAIFGNSEENIEDFLSQHLNVVVTHQTYSKIFENTPLNHKWRWMTPKLRTFSARIIQLWEYGGVSYDLSPQFFEFEGNLTPTFGNSSVYGRMIHDGLERFQNLSSWIVSVDSTGFHMEAKSPCHSFFGRILMTLKNSSGYISVRKVLKDAMKTYCKIGALDPHFCPLFYK